MRSLLFATALAAVVPGAALASAPTPQVSDAQQPGLRDLILRLQQAIDAEDEGAGRALLDVIITHQDFGSAPADVRESLLRAAGLLALDANNPAKAADYFAAALVLSPENTDNRAYYMVAQGTSGDFTGAAESAAIIARSQPALLDDFQFRYIQGLTQRDEVAGAARRDLRLALFEARWRVEDNSSIWLAVAEDLLAASELDRAAQAANLISSPGTLHRVFALNSKAGVAALLPPERGDLHAGYTAYLDRLAVAARSAAATADDLDLYLQYLVFMGKPQEALTEADRLLALAQTDPERGVRLNWVHDARSRALMDLGQHAEAVVALQAGAAMAENDQVNVSQAINLGWLYVRLGRPDQAREAVAVLREAMEAAPDSIVSPYGKMQLEQVASCALRGGARGDLMEGALYGYLGHHIEDAPRAYFEALACHDDLDEMESFLLRRLADPDHADEALMWMQRGLATQNPTEFDRRFEGNIQAVYARPDVQAAAARVGRILSAPVKSVVF